MAKLSDRRAVSMTRKVDVQIKLSITVARRACERLAAASCPAHSFNSDTLSVDAIRTDPTVDAPAIVANLESVALPGLDEVNILVPVNLAQDDVANLKIVRSCRHNGA